MLFTCDTIADFVGPLHVSSLILTTQSFLAHFQSESLQQITVPLSGHLKVSLSGNVLWMTSSETPKKLQAPQNNYSELLDLERVLPRLASQV